MINGKAVYDAWWEMYSSGDGQPEQVISSLTIKPGDSMSASVVYNSSTSQFVLTISDNTSGKTFSIDETSSAVQNPTASRESAEWIVEAPQVGGSIATVANFGSVTFTNASATINGVTGPINDSAWQSAAIDIEVGRTVYDTTSVLIASGTSFVVTYNTSAGSNQGGGGRSGSSFEPAPSFGTNPSGKRTAGTVLIGPAWTGASSLWSSRTPVRQGKPLVPSLTTGSLFD